MAFNVRMNANYQRDIQTLRQYLDAGARSGQIVIEFEPPGAAGTVELMMRCSDAYIIGFKGADGWNYLKDDKPKGADGHELAIEGNYNKLTAVGPASLASFRRIMNLKTFKRGVKGAPLDQQAIVLVAAAVSEAVRSATVNTYMTGLVNLAIQEVPMDMLKEKYFLRWAEHCSDGSSDVLLQKI